MNLENHINRLNALRLNLEVHPENEPNSEFEGRITDLDNAINDLRELYACLSSDSVYWSLRNSYKRPSDAGMDSCDDSKYIDLYRIVAKMQN